MLKTLLTTLRCFALYGVSLTALATDLKVDRQGVYLAPGWGKLSFQAPAAGSYSLPAIGAAADGKVLDTDGESQSLADLMRDKVTLLSFIYRTCDDVNGCPLSTMVLYTTGNEIAKQQGLNDKLRILTLSFDPEFDTPEVMKEFSQSLIGEQTIDWHFLTSQSDQAIKPILDAYQQSVVPDVNNEGEGRNKFSHILRVYLIDRKQQIRNIYSMSFLHPDILINDVKTLLLEDAISNAGVSNN
ncbi:MAG: cytochrome c peroxidase [Arenicella sp.]|jgi:cytochrome c peroxidase